MLSPTGSSRCSIIPRALGSGQDSAYLFDKFIKMMEEHKNA